MKNKTSQAKIFLSLLLLALTLLLPQSALARHPGQFVKKIRIIGNTLIDPYFLDDYLDLGNGLIMTPRMMDLVVSELKANYSFHGFPFVEAHSTLKVRNGVMTIKVDERNEFQWGRPRAERAVLKQTFLHDVTLKDSRKQKIIATLIKGYQKQRAVEKIVAKYLVQKQRQRIEGIKSQKNALMREKIAGKIKEYQTTTMNLDAQETRRVELMRSRVEAAGMKKVDDLNLDNLEVASEEYSDLDEFIDNIIFEESLNPGL
jgi:hypothetical protein